MSGCFDNSRALVKEQTGVTDTGTIYFCRFGYFFRAVIVERFYDFVNFLTSLLQTMYRTSITDW